MAMPTPPGSLLSAKSPHDRLDLSVEMAEFQHRGLIGFAGPSDPVGRALAGDHDMGLLWSQNAHPKLHLLAEVVITDPACNGTCKILAKVQMRHAFFNTLHSLLSRCRRAVSRHLARWHLS